LTIPPINQTTLAGETAHFSCISKDKDAVAMWYKDGVSLGNIPDPSNRDYIKNGSLTISPPDVTDPGEYTCEIKNPQGDTQTASAYLNVQCEYSASYYYSDMDLVLLDMTNTIVSTNGNVITKFVMLKAKLWIKKKNILVSQCNSVSQAISSFVSYLDYECGWPPFSEFSEFIEVN
jgi:hypothetical protein